MEKDKILSTLDSEIRFRTNTVAQTPDGPGREAEREKLDALTAARDLVAAMIGVTPDPGSWKCTKCGNAFRESEGKGVEVGAECSEQVLACPFCYANEIDEAGSLVPPDDEGGTCPHGEPWGSCDHCDYLGDMAFDSAREDAAFGR